MLKDYGFDHQGTEPPLGQYSFNRADLTMYAEVIETEESRNLTGDMVLEVIELLMYCMIGGGSCLEVEAEIDAGDVRAGVIDVKLARVSDWAAESESIRL